MTHDQAASRVFSIDPRTRPMESWRGRLAVMGSRGEVDGERVAEAREALSIWRTRTFLIREMKISRERADEMLDPLVADRMLPGAAGEPGTSEQAVSPAGPESAESAVSVAGSVSL